MIHASNRKKIVCTEGDAARRFQLQRAYRGLRADWDLWFVAGALAARDLVMQEGVQGIVLSPETTREEIQVLLRIPEVRDGQVLCFMRVESEDKELMLHCAELSIKCLPASAEGGDGRGDSPAGISFGGMDG